MNKMEFDEILHKPFDGEIIDYGIIKGNNTVFFIKAGQDGSMSGYENKYLSIAHNLNKKYGYTTICSSNPFRQLNPLDQAMEVIESYVQSPYQVYYMGQSCGALIGASVGYQYPQIKRMLLINGPMMINWHKTKAGATKFQGEKMVFIYGENDPSFKFVGLLDLVNNPAKSVHIIPGADHNFVGMLEEFEKLPEQYLVG